MTDSPVPPPGSPPPSPSLPHHSRNSSLGGSSHFSESNPLTSDDPSAYYKAVAEPKKPKAVALHGWQRTVGADADFEQKAVVHVRLGAPGTGLYGARAGHKAGAAANGGAAAVRSLGNARVTREDKKEAKSLRMQPALPDAAPLPYPRVSASADPGSGSSSSDEMDDEDPTDQRMQQRERQRQRKFETQSSTASSDLSFLVATAPFAARGTFGRKMDPRIPATVGEERLHNSLAQYLGKARQNVRKGGAVLAPAASGGSSGDGGVDGDSTGGESRSSSSKGAATAATAAVAGGGKGGTACRIAGDPAAGSGAAAAAAAAAASAKRTHVLAARSGSTSTMNTSFSGMTDYHNNQDLSSANGINVKNERNGGDGGEVGGHGGGQHEVMIEEGRLPKRAGIGNDVSGPGQRVKCTCLQRWPWKILTGVVSLAAVALVSTAGGSISDSAGRLFSPQLLLSTDGRGAAGASAAARRPGEKPWGGLGGGVGGGGGIVGIGGGEFVGRRGGFGARPGLSRRGRTLWSADRRGAEAARRDHESSGVDYSRAREPRDHTKAAAAAAAAAAGVGGVSGRSGIALREPPGSDWGERAVEGEATTTGAETEIRRREQLRIPGRTPERIEQSAKWRK